MTSSASSSPAIEALAFTSAGQRFALPILVVQEVRRYEALSKLVTLPPEYLGVLQLRGEFVPVLDLAHKLNFGKLEPAETSVILVLKVEGKNLGLAVDSVDDVVRCDENTERTPPFESVFVSKYFEVAGQLLQLLTPERFISPPTISSL